MDYDHYDSPLGPLLMAADGGGLSQLWLPNEVIARVIPADWHRCGTHPLLRRTRALLDAYFAKEHPCWQDLPLTPQGTAFQRRVWQQLSEVPYGQCSHYGELARRLDNPRAVRAVGGAVGRNPIAILIPCHRILGKGGNLTGYSGGLAIKRALLELEGIPYRP
ncbi:DNA repair enzyme Ada (O6-methylguanine-DNA--protein-cysteine methyltransferase) [Edwardsiella anguillarum]|uniref:methylated-DNA--[protein]-cysteine S-methyltransferase n=1 Tax=Edwardsiella TaxID=635 RepID=UPI00045D1F59|nr:methylated-DNA--[protein]-cysteine S-methyltransferase [Edwardsiella anguillarum]AKM47478.1 cysteine methyltransferase [Edwardsiella sp. EA181011]GAJ66172.1 methylated-DNA--protein-cysteine methyltransferase [Edwardsiella piscicida]RFT02370.1 methylated-DNA--[protein]-cysteine S-methyltransferase [Edwardsiella anguillarum]BET81249.1 DNA repair enzyme Ada (O6-methylguanine-DNA--protein-cysteine methyltransferase) [Edwardsiella anguillarum]BET84676.1 DNA repair enzyme Ada (O6-methylguanine-DN